MRLRAPPLLLPLVLLLCAAPGDAQVILESSARYAKTKVAASPDGGYLSADFSQALFWQPQGGMLVNGTNIMVMADTQNQAIRKVDWGERTVGHLAGNPGVQGDCLDQSCPANSFTDGVGLAATFTMPYAVQLHHQQRHAFVADTRSGAIRRVHLYTNQVHTVLRGLGHPTDVVSWGDKIAFCDGLKHSIWLYSGVSSALMAQSDGEWPTSASLHLLSGSNSPLLGQYAEGPSSGTAARFWEPLGITYDPNSGLLYVADYRNRVIRSVHPTTGATARVVGNQADVTAIRDHNTNPLQALLCGPTNLQYYHATRSVYFSDRNPDTGMGALRVWHVATNRVLTVVGKAAGRQQGDGLVTGLQVGTSAIWGVVAGGHAGTGPEWWGWTEADTHALRMVGSTLGQADKMPCPVGKYFKDTACTACTSRLPTGAKYTEPGSPQVDYCAWQCPDPPMYRPFVCPEFAAAVPNAALATTDGTEELVVCKQGFSKESAAATACGPCPVGSFCDGFNAGGTGEEGCTPFSTSVAGSSTEEACSCIGGYHGGGGATCHPCPAGTFCPPGTSGQPSQCPTNSVSLAVSDDATDCSCVAGFYGANGDVCFPCAAGTYCLGGASSTACPANTVSVAGSDELDDCTCAPNYYGLGGAGACTTCPPDTYCEGVDGESGGSAPTPCPNHTSSPAGSDEMIDCLCIPGYHGPAGGECTGCVANTYCPGGVVAQTACHTNSFSPALSASQDACLCNIGFQDSGDVDVCSPCSSAMCDPGLYRTQCTVYASAPDADSVCELQCTAPSAAASFAWTSGGSYISAPEYRGRDDCAFSCNTHYYRTGNGGGGGTSSGGGGFMRREMVAPGALAVHPTRASRRQGDASGLVLYPLVQPTSDADTRVFYGGTGVEWVDAYRIFDKSASGATAIGFLNGVPPDTSSFHGYRCAWVGIDLGSPMTLHTYSIRHEGTNVLNAPSTFRVYGSGDGVDYDQLDQQTWIYHSSTVLARNFTVPSPAPYRYLVLCVREIGSGLLDRMELRTWELFGVQAPLELNLYPTVQPTSDADTRLFYGGTGVDWHTAYHIFDRSSWGAIANGFSAGMAPETSVFQGYRCAWVGIDMGTPMTLHTYSMRTEGTVWSSPADFRVWGSWDGVNYDQLDDRTGATYISTSTATNYSVPAPAPYRYLALGVQRAFHGQMDRFDLRTWELFGVPYDGPVPETAPAPTPPPDPQGLALYPTRIVGHGEAFSGPSAWNYPQDLFSDTPHNVEVISFSAGLVISEDTFQGYRCTWVGIDLREDITLYKYTIGYEQTWYDQPRLYAPKDFKVWGSIDGVVYRELDSQVNTDYDDVPPREKDFFVANYAEQGFIRYVVLGIQGLVGEVDNLVLKRWKIWGVPYRGPPGQVLYPLVRPTSDADARLFYGGAGVTWDTPFRAFDSTTTARAHGFVAGMAPEGSVFQGYRCAWIGIDVGTTITLHTYALLFSNTAPSDFRVWGSLDGVNYTQIGEHYGVHYEGHTVPSTNFSVATPAPYRYFALGVQKLTRTTATTTRLDLKGWELFGLPYDGPLPETSPAPTPPPAPQGLALYPTRVVEVMDYISGPKTWSQAQDLFKDGTSPVLISEFSAGFVVSEDTFQGYRCTWVGVDLRADITLYKYTIGYEQNWVEPPRLYAPKDFKVWGSFDGVVYRELDSQVNTDYDDVPPREKDFFVTNYAEKKPIRHVVLGVQSLVGDVDYLLFDRWKIWGIPYRGPPGQVLYPLVKPTSDADARLFYGGTGVTWQTPFLTFDGSTQASYASGFVAGMAPEGSVFQGYRCAWVGIDMGSTITLHTYAIAYVSIHTAPSDFRVWGSLDGASYTQIGGHYGIKYGWDDPSTNFSVATPAPYRYFALGVQKLTGTTATATSLDLRKWELFGLPWEAPPSSTVVTPTSPSNSESCTACNSDPQSCGIGLYLDREVSCRPDGSQDSQCVPCTNKPAHSTYTARGTLDGNDCPWQCNPGYYSDTAQCLPCTASACGYGDYRGQCTRGTSTAAGTDSTCSLRCTTANADTGTGAVQPSFTWTGLSTYDSAAYRGRNDCTLACNFGTPAYAEGHFWSNPAQANPHLQVCSKITARDGTCGVGAYTLEATPTADTRCVACSNYPAQYGEANRLTGAVGTVGTTTFRWHSTGSVNDPYGHDGSTCEFQCYEGASPETGGYYLDTSQPHTMGEATGNFPIEGACGACDTSQCGDVGLFRGVCQAAGVHTDRGTCVECMHQRVENSVPVGWHYLYPGEDTCQFACIDDHYHTTAECTLCKADPGPAGANCLVGQYLDRSVRCTNNSDSVCEPCSPGTFDNGDWAGTGFDDPLCRDVPSECDRLYFSSGARTNGSLDCVPCQTGHESCAPGFYLPFCERGELYDAACEACTVPPPANSQITRGTTLGVDSCSYLCDGPGYYDTFDRACGVCSTDISTCPTGQYLDACVSNNNTQGEALARQAECRACTYLPEHATYTGNGFFFNVPGSCQWSCAQGFHRVNGYLSGHCEPCYAGPCAAGEYLDGGCGADDPLRGGANVGDNVCTACTNGAQHSHYTSDGTVSADGALDGRNDCQWRCNVGYVGPDAGGQCVLSPTCDEHCPDGQYREACTDGMLQEPRCLPCTAAPYGGVLGPANPFNQDGCPVECREGWYTLAGQRFCCSDNSYIDGTGLCTCSAGFRIGPDGVDGADCRP